MQTGLAKGRKNVPHPVLRPYLRVANVQAGWLDLAVVKQIVLGEGELTRYALQPNDVLLTEGGDFDKLGRGTIWRGEIPECVHQNHVFAVRTDRAALLPEFLTAWTSSLAGRRYFLASSKQTTNLASINASQVRQLPLALPPVAEQKRIIAALGTWDRLLDLTRQVCAAKRRFMHGLMQELLTAKRRFKEFDGKPWRVSRLGDLFDERVESDRADLSLLSITADRGVIPRDEVDRKDTSNADKSKYLRVAPGDIGYNTMRMWQGVSALSAYEGIVSPAYTVCVPRPSVHPAFAAYLFKLPAVIDLFRRHSQGLVDDTLNLKYPHFARIEVSLPDLDEQQAVAELLQALDREIGVLEELRNVLDCQRRGIAELLLTGKVRIPA